MDIFLLAVIAILSWVSVHYCFSPLIRFVQLRRALSVVPSPEPGHWLLGHLPILADRYVEDDRVTRWVTARRRIMRIDIVASQEIVLTHPDTASLVFRTAEPKGPSYRHLYPWLGNGLLLSTGKRWARDRRLLTRGFHFDILRGYLPVYKEAAEVMLEQWARVGHQGNDQAVNVTQSSKYLTLDVILRCIMSFESNCQSEDADKDILEYVQAVLGLTKCLTERYFSPLQYFDLYFALCVNGRKFYRLRDISHRVSQGIIRKRREALADDATLTEAEEMLKTTSRKYLDFLDILLTVRDEDGQGLSDTEIQEQVDTFLFEGHDTTASALQWTLYYLAKYPGLQEKCRQEVERTLDESKEVSYEQLNKLLYLTQFIKESMRLKTPVPCIVRTLTEPLVIDGYLLPKGTSTFLSLIAIHRNPDVWEKPNEFDPDRFSVENPADRSPYAFVPFSAGPRNCIGQALAMEELKTVIAKVLLRFRLTVKDDQAKPILHAEIVTRAKEDIMVYAHAI